MNRSLLLVVCDFLLLSILALARFDVPEGATIAQDGQKIVSKEVIERISDGENYDDVVAELEATNETLLENLSSDKDALQQQKEELEAQIIERQKELEAKEKEIESRDEVIAGNEEAIAQAQKDAVELERQKEEIAKKREKLLQSNAASKKELELLAKNLEEAKKKQEELAALKDRKERETESMKVELAATLEKAKAEEKAADEAKAMLIEEKKRADALVASTENIDKKIDSLNLGLEGVGKDLRVVGEGLAGVGDKITSVTAEVSSVKEDVSGVKEDVSKVGAEVSGMKNTVAEVSQEVSGVGTKVEDIQREVEETAAVQKENFERLNDRQKQSLNQIYTRYDENKVKLNLKFTYKGGFLGAEKTEEFTMDSIILADDSFAYTLVHSNESPFRLQPRPRSLISVEGEITSEKLDRPIQIREIAFMDDPRIIIIPLYLNPKDLTKETDIEIFSAPQNPYLFSEAVVVDSKDRRFGQTNFLRDEKDSRYIKVEHASFAFLTGEFDPSKSDLVFSQKGELLGIMINNNYAFHVKNLGNRLHAGSRTLLGGSFELTKTNNLLSDLSKKLFGLQKKFR
ncbi:MAG: hypothetical protein CBC16_07485 [Verrucomicrobia bacterium TMED56]|nr:MAG: hypothetical protein CBC16_07485 [Verrucomicrobia bacterium TMED56]